MTDAHETATGAPEMASYPLDPRPLPSLWQSVLHAFRQARLARLEARVRRLRRRTEHAPIVRDQPLLVVASAYRNVHEQDHSVSAPTRRLWTTAVAGVMILGGVTASVLHSRSSLSAVTGVSASLNVPQSTPPSATSPDAASITALEEQLAALRQQVEPHGDQLRTQHAAIVSITQGTDTQNAQLVTLADALTAVSDQVQQLAQQVTSQATRVATHEQQLAIHTAQLGVLRTVAGTPSVRAAPRRRSGPPTLELLAPPAATTPAVLPGVAPTVPTVEAQGPRRTITLPASLGMVGFRREAGKNGGPHP